MGCLAKRAEARPQTAALIGEALDRIAIDHPWPQRAARAWWTAHAEAPAVRDAAAPTG
jgi:hypothetical protein